MMTLGERVVMWRKRRKMTQKELAAQIPLHPMTLSKIERGEVKKVRADTLKRLAQVLRVKADYLLGLVREEDAEVPEYFVPEYSIAHDCPIITVTEVVAVDRLVQIFGRYPRPKTAH
jgi:transcriptional regulator with XRE-family HTH domain